MAVNPKTYEGLAMGLSDAGHKVTRDVGKALTDLHRGVIKDPDNLSKLAGAYTEKVRHASKEWEKNWRQWADDDVLRGYRHGVSHTNIEMNKLKQAGKNIRPPNQPLPDKVPLAKNMPTITDDLPITDAMRRKFRMMPNHLTAANVFRRAAYHNLEGTSLQILRASNDLYRDVAVQATSKAFKEADVFTRRQLSQSMLNDFAQKGVQSIVYKDGKKMSIEAYSEMVGRTTSGRAAMQGSLNRYAEHGYDLVRVSSHFRACDLCIPYEGAVLSQSGDSNYESLDSAITQGLFHPNCAHDVSPYIPGLSPEQEVRVSPEEQALIDEHGYSKAQKIAYKAQARQRGIERHIRNWKMRETTALDSGTQRKARRKVLEWQKAQRAHLQRNPYLPRKYQREAVPGYRDAVRARGRVGAIDVQADNLAMSEAMTPEKLARLQETYPEEFARLERFAQRYPDKRFTGLEEALLDPHTPGYEHFAVNREVFHAQLDVMERFANRYPGAWKMVKEIEVGTPRVAGHLAEWHSQFIRPELGNKIIISRAAFKPGDAPTARSLSAYRQTILYRKTIENNKQGWWAGKTRGSHADIYGQTLDHELGHVLHDYVSMTPKFAEQAAALKNVKVGSGMSQYGKSSSLEAFAESFVAITRGNKTRIKASPFMQEVERLLETVN